MLHICLLLNTVWRMNVGQNDAVKCIVSYPHLNHGKILQKKNKTSEEKNNIIMKSKVVEI